MLKMVVDSVESRAVWLYDQSLPQAERSEKKLFFHSMMAAGNFLGVEPRHIFQRMSDKHLCTSKNDGKKYAIRPASINSEKLKPMEEIKITVPDGKSVSDLFRESVKIMERIRYWSNQGGRAAELKKEMWQARRDEFLESLNLRQVNNQSE
jgi:hypothetical protein